MKVNTLKNNFLVLGCFNVKYVDYVKPNPIA
jgi:hypothetical protein